MKFGQAQGRPKIGSFQTDCDVTLFGKHLEVAPWSAAKIEYRERRLTLDMPQQRLNFLADVVIVRAFPEFFGTLIVVLQSEAGDFLQVLYSPYSRCVPRCVTAKF
jgi:hypothetical protein